MGRRVMQRPFYVFSVFQSCCVAPPISERVLYKVQLIDKV